PLARAPPAKRLRTEDIGMARSRVVLSAAMVTAAALAVPLHAPPHAQEAGHNSVLAVDRFAFDSTTHQGSFESSLRTGTLAVVSGKLAKQSPEAMKVRTPAAV